MNDSLTRHAVCLPATALRPFISHYAGFRAHGPTPCTHAGLPSRHVDLIISLGRPIEVIRMPSARQDPATLEAFVSGLQDAPALVRQGGDFDGLHLFLKPHGVRAILGVSSHELTSHGSSFRNLGPAAGAV